MERAILKGIVIVLVLGLGSIAYAQGWRPYEPFDPEKSQSLPLSQAEIVTEDGAIPLQVELADTNRSRGIGLMHRAEIAPDRGMLFDFGSDRVVRMWMRNTFISLDMFFIDRAGRIVYIAENTVPHSEKTVTAGMPVRAVLEMGAGSAKRLSVEAGDTIRHAMFGNGPE